MREIIKNQNKKLDSNNKLWYNNYRLRDKPCTDEKIERMIKMARTFNKGDIVRFSNREWENNSSIRNKYIKNEFTVIRELCYDQGLEEHEIDIRNEHNESSNGWREGRFVLVRSAKEETLRKIEENRNYGVAPSATTTTTTIKNGKGENIMKNFKGMFGKIMSELQDGEVAMTMSGGVAIKRTDGDYVSYDAVNGQIINQHDFIMDGFGDMFMLMPVQEIAVDDIIKIKETFYHITGLSNTRISAVNLSTGRTSAIVKEVSAFGFNFYSKLVNMMQMMNGGNTNSNGMGGLMGMMMMKEMMGKGDDDASVMGGGMMGKMMQMQMMMGMMGGQGMMGNMVAMFGQAQPQIVDVSVQGTVATPPKKTGKKVVAEPIPNGTPVVQGDEVVTI